MFRILPNILIRSLAYQPVRLASSASNSKTPVAPSQMSEQKAQPTSTENQDQPISVEANQERLDDLYRYLWIRTQAHEQPILTSYETFVKMAADHLNIEYVKTEAPFRTIKRRTLLASRHVHKKYRTQYETRTYYRDILFKNLTGSTMETFLEYIERNVPEGLLFAAEKHRLGALPFDLVGENPEKNVN